MLSILILISSCVFALYSFRDKIKFKNLFSKRRVPVSVNYHFTRVCNKSCGFCFHTAKTSHMMPEEEAKRGLALLKKAGMRKINFAGGEPFIAPKFLGSMLQYCKEDLKVESVSIVTNGSLVTESFIKRYGKYIDIIAVSCDSFHEETNIEIGRGNGDNVKKLFQISNWCRQYNIKFKMNTVVCRLNYQEDMVEMIEKLQPFRWKCFQVLMVEGENDSEKTLRDVRKFQITDEQFELFCSRHRKLACFVPEPNNVMASSYLILDEYMRFLDKGDGQETASSPILEVGVSEALAQVRWDEKGFETRGGLYDWQKAENACNSICQDKNLEW